tara:strand:- start:308 stop:646 length:339 start_codon:yes stop_codon:yes gene_type:complete
MTTGTITVPEAADGAWIVTFGMQWKNDQGGLTKHRRKLRLMNGIYPLAEIPEVLFDPAMGDLTENSAHNGVASIKLPGLGGRVVHMEAWQNSGIAVNIVTSSIRMVRLGDAQ